MEDDSRYKVVFHGRAMGLTERMRRIVEDLRKQGVRVRVLDAKDADEMLKGK